MHMPRFQHCIIHLTCCAVKLAALSAWLPSSSPHVSASRQPLGRPIHCQPSTLGWPRLQRCSRSTLGQGAAVPQGAAGEPHSRHWSSLDLVGPGHLATIAPNSLRLSIVSGTRVPCTAVIWLKQNLPQTASFSSCDVPIPIGSTNSQLGE